jgi:hypothetical protein
MFLDLDVPVATIGIWDSQQIVYVAAKRVEVIQYPNVSMTMLG